MADSSYTGFIAGAYGISGLLIIGLIIWVIWDKSRLDRQIAALERQGIKRRSKGAGSNAAGKSHDGK